MKSSAQLIVEDVKKNGGSITSAARRLNLKLTKRIRAEIVEIDNNVERYRYAFKRHGNWLTLPTDKAESRDAQRLESVCLCCNQIHSVSLISLVSGRSTGCHACRMKERENLQVSCAETGQTYSSIREFARAVGQIERYQSLRHKLQSAGSVTVDGLEFNLN